MTFVSMMSVDCFDMISSSSSNIISSTISPNNPNTNFHKNPPSNPPSNPHESLGISSSQSESSQSSSSSSQFSHNNSDNNHEIVIDPSPNPHAKLFIGQVPQHCAEAHLQTLFEPYGEILEVVVLREKRTIIPIGNHGAGAAAAHPMAAYAPYYGHQGKYHQPHKGCAFVSFKERASAERAIEELNEKITLHQRPLVVRFAGQQQQQQAKYNENGEKMEKKTDATDGKLFCGMLQRHVNETELGALFATCGEVREVYIMRDERACSRGCAFIKMETRKDAQRAIQTLDGQIVPGYCNRGMVVRFAEQRSARARREQQMVMYANYDHFASLGFGYPFSGGAGYENTGPPVDVGSLNQHQYYHHEAQHQVSVVSPNLTPELGAMSPYMQSSAAATGPPTFQLSPSLFGITQPYYPSPQFSAVSTPILQPQMSLMLHAPSNFVDGSVTLLCYNLPESYDESMLYQLLAPYEQPLSVRIVRDHITGASKGFGDAVFARSANAHLAAKMLNGYSLQGRKLQVLVKQDPKQRLSPLMQPSPYVPHVSMPHFQRIEQFALPTSATVGGILNDMTSMSLNVDDSADTDLVNDINLKMHSTISADIHDNSNLDSHKTAPHSGVGHYGDAVVDASFDVFSRPSTARMPHHVLTG